MLISEPFDAQASARDRIVASACRLFYQDGIRATGVDKIIAAAGVTKVTFYRHFPAKNDLVLAFLQVRHQRWIAAFQQALAAENGEKNPARALAAALHSWFQQPDFRGCAFINAATELADTLPEALAIVQQHKQAMCAVIAAYLPAEQQSRAEIVAFLVDGAIVQVQMGKDIERTVLLLGETLGAILGR
ncbi:TetR/AcrR family transcriptional regulator [Erwiniaceae bacterium BAC15a-03b]|uniref:TetR/AcrR family transcriptional regulator n=1 Tax=Winslowiella arboricola TaxID=2978220 RepID=A0A9J6PPN9_9GAMM|nr:TetR/AcrR family transcriptional regulator [Winslowiella arboricola]MCU5773127.1 TetR/AcrR family transcriptional regulator [Winslowiella arboricola]MCU5778710.1 TetR/AcrR family transcriptional regulator [Winslowiella arboricola]